MPKKRNDLFINRSIVTNRKRLKHNWMICDYMWTNCHLQLTLVTFVTKKSHHTFFGHIYDYVTTISMFSFFQWDDFSCYFPLRRPSYGPLVAKMTKKW